MNNRGQNVNLDGTPQKHHPNQGYPQQNNQYQENGYNGQNPQNFNRNINNQNPYQNQNSQANNVNNPQFQGYSNGQNQPQNNMNNPQYRGQGYNGQNPQFGNPNNPQFSNQNGYNNPNQFNPQSGNNQNFNPMNRRPKMNSKMIGYITAAVAAILVVLMIFMFSSGSGKLGAATPLDAVLNARAAAIDGDFKKLVNNIYFESDEARTKGLAELNNLTDGAKKELVKTFGDSAKIEEKPINENRVKVELKFSGDTTETRYVKKVNDRWFIEKEFFSLFYYK